MEIWKTIQECRDGRRRWADETIALVPTMGALHEGHLALTQMAIKHADRLVVSIFVNPLQFSPSEDFSKYPRTLVEDIRKCQEIGADAVFIPDVNEIYPEGQRNLTSVLPPSGLTDKLCGLSRPGHFTGVATVVMKFFNIVQPDVAVFGEKDAQQLAVIRKMVRDLNMPVEVLAHPTVRDAAGMALSSRNRYLETPEEKNAALVLSLTLKRIRSKAESAVAPYPSARQVLEETLQEVLTELQVSPELFTLDYLQAVDRNTFQPVDTLGPNAKVLMAARVGAVRLIDNLDLVAGYVIRA